MERGNECVAVIAGRKRHAGEDESGGPALGAFAQRFDLLVRGCRASLGEQHGRFVGSEPQVIGAHFGQLAPHAEPRQPHRGVETSAEHQRERRRGQLDQSFDGLIDRRVVDEVVVVDDQHHRRTVGELVGEPLDDDRGVSPRAGYGGSGGGFDAGGDHFESGDDMAPETGRITVGCIVLEPCAVVATLLPCGQHRRLSRSGRCARQHNADPVVGDCVIERRIEGRPVTFGDDRGDRNVGSNDSALRHPHDHRNDVENLMGGQRPDGSCSLAAAFDCNGAELFDQGPAGGVQVVRRVCLDLDVAREGSSC